MMNPVEVYRRAQAVLIAAAQKKEAAEAQLKQVYNAVLRHYLPVGSEHKLPLYYDDEKALPCLRQKHILGGRATPSVIIEIVERPSVTLVDVDPAKTRWEVKARRKSPRGNPIDVHLEAMFFVPVGKEDHMQQLEHFMSLCWGMTEQSNFDKAVEELRRRCMSGGEFPDEIWKVSQEFKVDQSALTAAYDKE